MSARAADLARELLLEAPAAEEAGQRIAVGEVLQLDLERLALRDIHRLHQDQPLAVRAERQARRRQRADLVPAAVQEAQLGGGRASRQQIVEHLLSQGQIVGMDDLDPHVAEQLARVAPEHVREREVALHDLGAAIVVHAAHEHADRRRLEHRLEEGACGGELAGAALALGDVERDAAETDDGSLRVAHGELQRPHVALPARARIGEDLVEALRAAVLDDLAIVRREPRVDLGAERLRHRVPDELLGGLAHDPAGLGVGDDPALVEVAEVDRHRAVGDDRVQMGRGLRERALGGRLGRDVA